MLKISMALASACFILAGASAASAQESSRIFQPGAPGEPSRQITAEQSLALGETSHISEDAQFMQHMIVHHAQAVEMVSLIADRSDYEGVQQLGLRIAMSQEQEIAFMERWLTSRDEPTISDSLHEDHEMSHGDGHAEEMDHSDMNHADMGLVDDPSDVPVMVGMLSPAQMAELRAADGLEFDRLFLNGMIQHHMGALYMVDELRKVPGSAEDPILSGFLNDIYADQTIEINRMRRMLNDINS